MSDIDVDAERAKLSALSFDQIVERCLDMMIQRCVDHDVHMEDINTDQDDACWNPFVVVMR